MLVLANKNVEKPCNNLCNFEVIAINTIIKLLSLCSVNGIIVIIRTLTFEKELICSKIVYNMIRFKTLIIKEL